MSKLDDIINNQYNLVHHEVSGSEQYEMWTSMSPRVKKQVKDLILELFKESDYEPYEFVEKVEKL